MMQMPLLDRRVILINDNDRLALITCRQHRRKLAERILIIRDLRLILCNVLKEAPVVLVQCIRLQKLSVTHKLLAQRKAKALIHRLPARLMRILKGKKDHRILSLKLPVLLSTGPYLLVREIDGGILCAPLKKRPYHIHHQRLAETPWSCKQKDLAVVIDHLTQQQGLVYIIALADHLLIGSDPHRAWQRTVAVLLCAHCI